MLERGLVCDFGFSASLLLQNALAWTVDVDSGADVHFGKHLV